jgi:hypothetical protein
MMKTLFDGQAPAEILQRLDKISPQSQRQWGKMEVAQMLAHCCNGIEMAMGKLNPKRVLIGKLIGGFFKSAYTNEKPFSQGDPTSDELRVTDARDFVKEKDRLAALIREFASGGSSKATQHPHPFFGSLKQADWGRGMYKHLDHHFRQFGA